VKTGNAWALAPPVAGQPTPENWAQGLNTITQVSTGPDGALYLMNIFFSGGGIDKGLFRIRYDGVTGVEPAAQQLLEPTVSASPNPARLSSGTTVRWQLARAGEIELTILDPSGRVVRTLLDKSVSTASGAVHWDGRGDDGRPVSAGMYFYRLRDADARTAGGKISLLR
jgi:hypothetical protein